MDFRRHRLAFELNGFSLIEMLVVMAIIAILSVAALVTYRGVISSAQRTRAQEYMLQVHTALVQVMQVNDAWPREVLNEARSGSGELTPEVAYVLTHLGAMAFTVSDSKKKSVGQDKFGIVDPWATDVIKQRIKSGSLELTTKVPSGGTIQDHRLRFAIDDDYDGIVKVPLTRRSVSVRTSCAVWGAGKDGKFGTADDLCSWAKGQEVGQ